MGEQIKGLFFTDRLRGIVTAVTMLLILVAVAGQWFFPRTVTVDDKVMDTMEGMVVRMERAADVIEKQASSTSQLNETLSRQFASQEANRTESYDILRERWGMGPAAPGTELGDLTADDPGYDARRVFEWTHDEGGGYLPTGAGPESGTGQLQGAAKGESKGTDGSTAGASGGGSNAPPKSSSGPQPVP